MLQHSIAFPGASRMNYYGSVAMEVFDTQNATSMTQFQVLGHYCVAALDAGVT